MKLQGLKPLVSFDDNMAIQSALGGNRTSKTEGNLRVRSSAVSMSRFFSRGFRAKKKSAPLELQ